jgi:hypothetical protein
MKLVRAPRPAAEMQQEDETVQAVRVGLLTLQDAVEDDLRRREVPVRFAGIIRVRPRAGRVIDERHLQLLGPSDDLGVVMLEWRNEISPRRLR